jgi:hypothetical protein
VLFEVRAMTRIGDRRFLHAWQTLRAASQPGLEATSWRMAEVTWRRNRLSHSCADFSVVQDAYHLDYPGPPARWGLLVVMETWWDSRRRVIRSQVWAAHMTGPKPAIQDWVRKQAERVDAAAGQTPLG